MSTSEAPCGLRIRWKSPDYARNRMHERRISERQVLNALNALNDPHRHYPSRDGRTVAERDTGMGNVLRVVYLDRPEGPLIVTVVRISPKGGTR